MQRQLYFCLREFRFTWFLTCSLNCIFAGRCIIRILGFLLCFLLIFLVEEEWILDIIRNFNTLEHRLFHKGVQLSIEVSLNLILSLGKGLSCLNDRLCNF